MPGYFGSRMFRRRLRGSAMTDVSRAGRIKPFGRGFLGLGIPLAVALLRDLTHPDGYIRQFYRRITNQKPTLRVIDTDYESIGTDPKEIEAKNKDTG